MKKCSIISATIVSLLVHILIFWALLTRFVGAPPAESIEAFVTTEEAMRLVDLVEQANKIKPDKARTIGVENNATGEETVASRQFIVPKFRRSEVPKLTSNIGTLEHRTKRGVRGRLSQQLAMREPAAPRPRLPATAITESLGTGLSSLVPEDYFPDYKHGGHTYVNVLKRPGVDYFVGLKRAFKMAWDPGPALREHYAANEVNTGTVKVVLGVSVDKGGNLDELFVLKGSGLSRYDQEALRTVRASAPFSGPPSNLLVDGTLRMSWTFVVYL